MTQASFRRLAFLAVLALPLAVRAQPRITSPGDMGPVAGPAAGSGGSLGGGGAMVAMPGAAQADTTGGPLRGLALEAGAGRIVTLPGGAANVFVADPKVVEVRPASASTLFVFGVAPGRTTVAAMDAAGHAIAQYQVTVRASAFGANEAASAIGRAMPGSGVRVDTQQKTMVLSGQVRDAAAAERVESIARGYLADGQTLDNRLSTASSIQVGLRVRVVEMSRSLTRALGVNWQTIGNVGAFATSFSTANAIGGVTSGALNSFNANLFGGGVEALVDLLAQDNLARMLAEPTLVAMSGETASFLVGGEFPIPIAQQNNAISVEYKQYGIQLAFVPTVLGDGRISLHVRPEVSDITSTGAVQLSASNNSISIPALTVRRADTTVQLGSGQSFAIAGLLQDNIQHSVNALPFLGEVPILGALFRSDNFQRNETELVILVTPYIVNPVNNPGAMHVPGEQYAPPNDLDRLVRLRQVEARGAPPPARMPGTAGFLVE
jgi:pilus assembly protein CpaC